MTLAIVEETETTDGGRTAARLDGPLDRTTFAAFETWLDGRLARAGVRTILLDLSGLTVLTAAGAGVFIGRWPLAAERGIRLAIYGIPAALMPKAALYGLPDLVGPYPDRSAAEAALRDG